MKALIFNVQKFSLNDGPGIRTVIFFKGCPLSCRWCSNPESLSKKVQIMWNKEKCLGCGTCVRSCPQKAILQLSDEISIQDDKCDGCGICIKNCPGHALTSEGEWKTVDDLMSVCLQDRIFYEESSGGITLSGGEPLMYPDFVIALLEALKIEGIHTAMETTGFASPEIFNRIIPHVNLLLFDIKHWDEEKHIEGTGVSNQLILKNMKYAVALGKEILPRIPVVPGFNDQLIDAEGFCRLLNEVNLTRVQLLPFHQFGENKYTQLGRDYFYKNASALHEEDLADYRRVFLQKNIDAFF